MKKLTLITLLSAAIVSIANSNSFSATPAGAAPQPGDIGLAERAAAPAVLPAGISDPQLRAAWVRLYQQTEAIDFGEAAPVSGRSLAEFLLAQAIPVTWATREVCGDGSCSTLTCAAGACRYASRAPIYVLPSERGDLTALTSSLAHEIFHRTQPFGLAGDTRYEEYWAFQVGARVAHTAWPKFAGYNPLDPDQLNVWFRENRLAYYFKFPEYPAAVASRVYRLAGGGDPYAGLPTLLYGTTPTR
jgi:hypothetical protein